jgi:hypothetical protein
MKVHAKDHTKWVLINSLRECGLNSCGSDFGYMENSLEHGHEISGKLKWHKFI